MALKAEDAKNGRDALLPIQPPEFVAELKAHLALFLPDAKAFPGMWADKGAEMLRVDLNAAGIPYEDEHGFRFDFHSFRGQLASMMNDYNVPLVTAAKIMRHANMQTTASYYTRVLVSDMADEMAKLPKVEAEAAEQVAVKTGTDETAISIDAKNMDRPVDSKGTDSEAKIKTYRDFASGQNPVVLTFPKNKKALVPQGEKGFLILAPPAGFEPATCGLTERGSSFTTTTVSNSYNKHRLARTGQRTVSLDKPDFTAVPSDLTSLVKTWPSIPDLIKQAIIAIVAPYQKEGDHE